MHLHLAPVLLHHALDGRQPEAGALTGRLGREERLKDVGQDLRGNPLSRVADDEPHESLRPARTLRRAVTGLVRA